MAAYESQQVLDSLLAHESAIRYYAVLVFFGAIACWEAHAPNIPIQRAGRRWGVGLLLIVFSIGCARAVFPLLFVGLAIACAQSGIGLLNLTDWPFALEALIAVLVIDGSRYGVHRMLHTVPILWRLHRVHHSDDEYDASTGLRFHPLEALVTTTLQLATVAAIGAPALVVLAYEVVHAFFAAWAHSNIRVPARIEPWLRLVLVTPALHSIHHSRAGSDARRNYAGVTTIWDRVFGSYARASCEPGPLRFGLDDVGPGRAQDLGWLLTMPFRPMPPQSPSGLGQDPAIGTAVPLDVAQRR